MAKKNKAKAKTKSKAKAEEIEEVVAGNGKAKESKKEIKSPDIEHISSELEKIKAQLKEAEDTNLRLQADIENIRRRKHKEISDAVGYAEGRLMNQVILIFDDIERMLTAAEKTDKVAAVKSGIESLQKKLKPTLEKMGLQSIGTKAGDEFDLNYHEAVTTIPVEEEDKKGAIVDVLSKGYSFKDKIIRFAKVILGE